MGEFPGDRAEYLDYLASTMSLRLIWLAAFALLIVGIAIAAALSLDERLTLPISLSGGGLAAMFIGGMFIVRHEGLTRIRRHIGE